jgi:V8-like Glu-specific endopeptidase
LAELFGFGSGYSTDDIQRQQAEQDALTVQATALSAQTTQFPNDAVVYVTDTIDGIEYQASGVLIAPDEVLTAAHVVWSTTGGAASDIEVSPGYNEGDAPFGTVGVKTYEYYPVDDSGDKITGQQSQFDFAVLYLSSPLSLGSFGLLANYGGGTANVSGYPAYLDGAQDNVTEPITQDPDYDLLDGAALGEGSSGGPVWIEGADGPQVVGIVSSAVGGPGSAGYFVQLTTADVAQIEIWNGMEQAATPSDLLVTNDFTGNGYSDILFQNSNSGLLLDWTIKTDSFVQSVPVAGTTPDWQYQATGQFQIAGSDDILFRDTNSGLLLYWQIYDGGYSNAVPIAATTPDWQVVGTGDFTGSGTDDILFENDNSNLFLYWNLVGGQYAGATPLAEAAPGWRFLGTGDFTGNGVSDPLFQNTESGLLLYWQLSDGQFGSAVPIAAATPDWKFLATGDFTGGDSDGILFQNTNSGLLLDWQLSDGKFDQAIPIASATPDWKFAGVGDYSGGNTDGILFQNINTGLVLDWQLYDGQFASANAIAGAGSDWKLL